ncbi:HAMP domain-containing sensor histidine kinase [Nemorincola caseinilytica]
MSSKLVIASIFVGMDSRPFVWNLIILVPILLLPVWLNHKGQISAARYFTVPTICVWLIHAATGFGPAMGLENYLYVVLVGVLVLETDTRWRYTNVIMIALGLIFVKLYNTYGTPYYSAPSLSRYFYIANIIITCLFIALICRSMLNDTHTEQRAMTEKKRKLAESNALRDKLFSMIAHDIKSPLHSLQDMLYALESGLMSKTDQKVLINELRQKTDVSSKTLSSLLDWASLHYRQQTSAIGKKETIFDLYEVTDHLAILYDDMLRKKQITLENEIHPGSTIYADKEQVLFILRNLIGNAVKYSETDGSARISLSAEKDNNNTNITIKDNGIGMGAGQVDTLFTTDHKRSATGTIGEKGTGLGLIFCNEFVTQHGGTMNVVSELGKGTEITFTIPHKQ